MKLKVRLFSVGQLKHSYLGAKAKEQKEMNSISLVYFGYLAHFVKEETKKLKTEKGLPYKEKRAGTAQLERLKRSLKPLKRVKERQ